MNASKAELPGNSKTEEFGKFVESRIARFESRRYDFDAL